jgi:hypothetical protein
LQRTEGDGSSSFVKEVWLFVRATGKWWLVPVLIALLLLGALALLSGTGVAPFIYTLF